MPPRHIRTSAIRQCHAPISAVLAEICAVLARFSASTAENRANTAGFTQTAHVFTYIYKKSRGLRFGIFVVGPQGFEPSLTEPKPVVTTITPWTKHVSFSNDGAKVLTKFLLNKSLQCFFAVRRILITHLQICPLFYSWIITSPLLFAKTLHILLSVYFFHSPDDL